MPDGSLYALRSRRPVEDEAPKRSRVGGPVLLFASGFDQLRIHGTGAGSDGGAQADPDANLGNYRSGAEVASLGIQGAMERITLERLSPGHEPGVGVLESDGAQFIRYTAPDSATPGTYKSVPPGSTVVLADGADASKAVRVARASGAVMPGHGARELLLVDQFNNALGFDNVSNAERAAGDNEYRALMVRNAGPGKLTVRAFLTPLGTQRTVNASGYAASGAVNITITTGTLKDWPSSGFLENQNTGEVLYYTSRTNTVLTVPVAGRDVYAEVGGGAAGLTTHALYPVSGLRIASEAPSAQPAGYIQTIANEGAAPSGVTWKHPISAADADVITFTLNPGEIQGLWLHRKVVAGATAGAKFRNFVTVEADDQSGGSYDYLLRGLFRMAETALERYELFRGVDADPDLTGSPWQTFSSLPYTTPALTVGHTYRFVLRKRNVHNLSSQNVAQTELVINGSGAEVLYPSAPEFTLAQAAAGAARLTAAYDYLADAAAARATHWAVWITDTGVAPDPSVDPPTYTVAMVLADGAAKLDYTDGGHAHGATLKAIVRARRDASPDVDSQNATVQTVTADANGPAAPTGNAAFLGGAAEQAP